MPVTLRYSAALDTTYSSSMMDDDDDAMSSTSHSRSRTSLAGSSDSLDLLVSGCGSPTASGSGGSGSGHSRQTSADSGADSRSSSSPSRELRESKDVVIASNSSRGLKSSTKPAHNPLQFVKTGVCPLYKKAAEQMKKAEEVRKVRHMTREEEEEWQSNLDDWKSKRRQIGQRSMDKALGDREEINEDHHQRQQQRKNKTFSEMMEERTRRSSASKAVIYPEDRHRGPPDPEPPQVNGNNDSEQCSSPTSRLNTSFDSSLSDHVFNEDSKTDMRSVIPQEECTFENAIRSYTQYAESRTQRGSATSASRPSSVFSSSSNSLSSAPPPVHEDGSRECSPVQHPKRELGDQVTLLVILKRGEPRDFGFGTKSGQESWGNVIVESVQPNGPADLAGLRINDEILSINGENTSNRSHSAIVFAIKQAVYTGSLEIRIHRARDTGHSVMDPPAGQDEDLGSKTPRSGSVMKRRSLFERSSSPVEGYREHGHRSQRSQDVAESLKERLTSFESQGPPERPRSWHEPVEDVRTDSTFQEKLKSFQSMNCSENEDRRRISGVGKMKAKSEQELDKSRRESEQRKGEDVGEQGEAGGDHTVQLVKPQVRLDTVSPSSGFELAETLQETAIVGSRPTTPDISWNKIIKEVAASQNAHIVKEPVQEAIVSIEDRKIFNLDDDHGLQLTDGGTIMVEDDEDIVPCRLSEPPKEKPPPPPVELETKADPQPDGEGSSRSIRKDIWRRRSNFLGTKASEVEDFIEREISHVTSPPDMESLLKAERQMEEKSRRERGSSSRSCDDSDTLVSAQQESFYENVPPRPVRPQRSSTSEDDEIARKEQEIIENLEREERQRDDGGKSVEAKVENGGEVPAVPGVMADKDRWEEARKLRAKEEELRRQEELLRLEKEKLRQEQEMLMRQKEAYKQQIEQHRQMIPASSTVPLRPSETSVRPKSAPPPPPPTKPRPAQNHPPLAHHPEKDISQQNYYDEPRAMTMPVIASQPSWSASSSSSASLSMSSSTASSGLSAQSLSASPKAKLIDDDRWKAGRKAQLEDSNVDLQRHWVVQEAEMRRIAEHNDRVKEEDRGYSVPQPLVPKVGRDSDYAYAYGVHAPAIRYTPAAPQGRSDNPGRTAEHDHHNQMAPPLPAPRRPLPNTPNIHEQAAQPQALTNGNGVGNSHHRDQQMLSVSGKKKCSHCKEELGRGAAMVIESLELFYHIHCFQCCVCHVQLGNGLSGADVRVRNHKLHCHNCYSSDDGLKFSKV